VSTSVDRIKKMIANFVEKRSGLVEGGCPLLNTAIESDDGNALLRGRARKALQTWCERISDLAKDGKRKREIDGWTDPRKLSQLIIGSLEGALMISRIEANDRALKDAQTFLNQYLEEKVRA
jgi:TetR/AcrR family transcriptional repressor of nem operon